MDVRSLTQQEAEDRAALLTIERYDVSVDLTALPTGPEVTCTSSITFTAHEPGASTFLDCCADVVAATLNGTALEAPVDGRITLPDLQQHNTVVVHSTQADTAQGRGVHKAVDDSDGEIYLWMSFEPDQARFVYACFDQPDLKAPHAFTVTAPGAWSVLSNSGNPTVQPTDAGTRVWTFPDTPPLSTYNPVVNAGPFYEIRRDLGGYDLGLHAKQSLAHALDREADEIFTITRQGLSFFGDAFGMPFPQRTYDQVFVPDLGGAMENYGCVTWSDAFLPFSDPTPEERQLLAHVLLHEMAHMWFGNIVTMRWWDDLWLNEAFAEFASLWAGSRATAYGDSLVSHLVDGKLQAYLVDQGPTSHPISTRIANVDEAASIFDAITYPKGASVLFQLMSYLGEDGFLRGMRAYFAEHAWGNTRLQDLMDALAAATGRDLDAWRVGWLETAGTDRLTLEHDHDGRAVLVGAGPDGPPRPQLLNVGSYRRAPSGALERIGLTPVEVTATRTSIALPADADFHLVNDEDLTFATGRPDARGVAALVEAASTLPDPLARGVVVGTLWDMLVCGELRARDLVHALTALVGVETVEPVLDSYLRIAISVSQWWAPDSERPVVEGEIAAQCRGLADRPGSTPSSQLVAARALAASARDEVNLTWLRGRADDDFDLQWRVLVRRAELDTVTDDEITDLAKRDPNPETRTWAATVRAAAPTEQAKAAAWQALAVDRSHPIGAVRQIAQAFWRPGQAEVLAPYADRYLEALPDIGGAAMIPAMQLTRALFPLTGIDDAFLDRAVAVSRQQTPIVGKSLRARADEVSRMLRSRALT